MFQERIRENYDEMTPGFRKLADFIMDHTLDVAFLTATRLSKRVGVDPATVVRFSQEMGYSGYRELSLEIKRYVRDQVTKTYREVDEAETEEELLLAILDSRQQDLQHFISTNMKQLVKAVQILGQAPHIWVVGEFTSYDLAHIVTKSLQAVGISATAIHPSMVEAATAVVQMQAGDVVFALAIGQPALDTGYTVQLANEKGLQTVCLTDDGITLPAREADTAVIMPATSSTDSPAFSIPMTLTALLCEALAKQHAAHATETFNAVQTTMEKLHTLRVKTPMYEVSGPA
jgi:DNA-binding MurR/RpiR family transcriptional regulator